MTASSCRLGKGEGEATSVDERAQTEQATATTLQCTLMATGNGSKAKCAVQGLKRHGGMQVDSANE